ncbi:CDP-diacylglycerol--serine O-phosphatidyltransferase [Thiopseudomonas alkaliphila]|uniref:CDP-diacylglycerol--serine O-phosphatidyltransferase n=1 Tax=Thiopseudomonas alkaliphila TaxID=1697053 RepID=UPI003570CECD
MSDKQEKPLTAKIEGVLPVGEHVEEVQNPDGEKARHRGVYLLPNLFTTANLFAGFYSLVCTMSGQFNTAAMIIFIAMILDGLDGRVARMTNTQSAFGAEYDSLSDMVAFGLAPAVLAYQWALIEMGQLGLGVSFIFAACAALRLARFNTQIGKVDKRWFIGLASPAAAGVVAGTVWAVWAISEDGVAAEDLHISFIMVFAAIVALAGLLMVSNVKYYSFKDFDFKGRVPFVVMLIAVLAFAIFVTDPPRVLLVVFLAYAASGPIYMATRIRRKNNRNKNTTGVDS